MTHPQPNALPPWVLFHVPHDATLIPPAVLGQFCLSKAELDAEVLTMTDHHTLDLLVGGAVPADQVVRAPVSRLVVDTERFEDDGQEVMVRFGMGVVYARGSRGQALRRPLEPGEREALLEAYYRPHHQLLTACVDRALAEHGRALVIDAHSFPAAPHACELDQSADRPQICLGTDDYHTPVPLQLAMTAAFRRHGYDVRANAPFTGALVPARHYRQEPRVAALMVEVNRGLYMDEATGAKNDNFSLVATSIQECLETGIEAWQPAG